MRRRGPRRRYSSNLLIDAFLKITARVFKFLEKEYGFYLASTDASALEGLAEYHNETTGIRIFYELGTVPRIVVSKLKRERGRNPEGYDLDQLLVAKCSKRIITSRLDPATLGIDDIESILNRYATMLKQYLSEVLTGDFSVFSKLKSATHASSSRHQRIESQARLDEPTNT